MPLRRAFEGRRLGVELAQCHRSVPLTTMGRPSKDATPCALLNKSVQLYKECDVCREAAEQPRAGLQCARIATGLAAPEF